MGMHRLTCSLYHTRGSQEMEKVYKKEKTTATDERKTKTKERNYN